MSWSAEEMGRLIGAVLSAVAVQQEGCRFNSNPGLFCGPAWVLSRGSLLSAHLEVEDGNGVGGKWQFASV